MTIVTYRRDCRVQDVYLYQQHSITIIYAQLVTTLVILKLCNMYALFNVNGKYNVKVVYTNLRKNIMRLKPLRTEFCHGFGIQLLFFGIQLLFFGIQLLFFLVT